MSKTTSFFYAIFVPVALLSAIWFVHMLQYFGLGEYQCLGVAPRQVSGLKGILISPLLHSTNGFSHILNNSAPLAVMLFFLFAVYRKLGVVVLILGWLLTGILVWLFADLSITTLAGSRSCHIGASGVVYMLAGFLFASGIIRRSVSSIAIACIVAFLYGSMIWGIVPQEWLPLIDPNVRMSWESHLFGMLVGVFLAMVFKSNGPKNEPVKDLQKKGVDPKSDLLWQNYLESLQAGEQPKTYEQLMQENRKAKKKWQDLL